MWGLFLKGALSIIKKYWSVILGSLLILAAYLYIDGLRDSVVDLNTKLAESHQIIGQKDQIIKERNIRITEYREYMRKLDQITVLLEKNVVISQDVVDDLAKQREEILLKMSKINLEPLTCEQKFSWLRDQAVKTGGVK